MNDQRRLRVFLCYATQDKTEVKKISRRLKTRNWIDPWMAEEKLVPGMDWEQQIYKAICDADVVILCLSNKSIAKEGYVQKEYKYALGLSEQKPDGSIFIIPLRLDDCDPPFRLKQWHWSDYFLLDAHEDLIKALTIRAGELNILTTTKKELSSSKIPKEEINKKTNVIDYQETKGLREFVSDFENPPIKQISEKPKNDIEIQDRNSPNAPVPLDGDLYIVRSGYAKNGQWINVLRWNPIAGDDIDYLVTRSHSGLQRMSREKKDRLGMVKDNHFIDRNCPVGIPTYYAIFPCYNGKVNSKGIWKYAGVRPGEVSNLRISWKSPDEVQLYWVSPKNAYNVIIRRAENAPPIFQWRSQPDILIDSPNSATDKNPPRQKYLYYTVWSIYRDPEPGHYKKQFPSIGISIQLPPYNKWHSTQSVSSVSSDIRVVLSSAQLLNIGAEPFKQMLCPVCSEPLLRSVVECNSCKKLYHSDCWDFIGGECGELYCKCRDAKLLQ